MSRRKKNPSTSQSTPSQRATDTKAKFWERVLGIWLAVFIAGLVGLGAWLLMGSPRLPVGPLKPGTPPPSQSPSAPPTR